MSDKIGSNTRGRAGLGRPKGSPNKISGSMKEMILGALEQAGGQAWLAKQANENPQAFMQLLAKLIPADVTLAANITSHEPITKIEWEVIDWPPRNDDA